MPCEKERTLLNLVRSVFTQSQKILFAHFDITPLSGTTAR